MYSETRSLLGTLAALACHCVFSFHSDIESLENLNSQAHPALAPAGGGALLGAAFLFGRTRQEGAGGCLCHSGARSQ